MRTLFYSTKDFEKPYLEAAGNNSADTQYIQEALSLHTAVNAKGFDAISIFTGDNASADVLEVLHNNQVKFITTRAAGYDNIDIVKAGQLGISVANVPAYSPYAVAEHAVALILSLNRKIIFADKQVHVKKFTTGNLIGFDLHGKTVGIVGVGKIGAVFAKIMHGFGCNLLGYDINENETLVQDYGLSYVDFPALCRESDIICIHSSLTPATKHMINRKTIGLMKQGVMLINTSRGACVNTKDVIDALQNGWIGYYGADVYENEKGIFFYDYSDKELKDDMLKELLSMPNVLITPHQAFATKEALKNIAATTFENIGYWSQKKKSPNELTIINQAAIV